MSPYLTLQRPLLLYGHRTAIQQAVPDQVKPSFVNFWHLGTPTLSPERQSARMSKIMNAGLTGSGTGCFIAVPIWNNKRERVKHSQSSVTDKTAMTRDNVSVCLTVDTVISAPLITTVNWTQNTQYSPFMKPNDVPPSNMYLTDMNKNTTRTSIRLTRPTQN